jgi:hypothetical protein
MHERLRTDKAGARSVGQRACELYVLAAWPSPETRGLHVSLLNVVKLFNAYALLRM